MPVEDIPVHEKVKISADKRYGCWGRVKMDAGYFATDRRYKPDGTYYQILTRIPHRNTTDCRYDLWESDPRCAGCTAEKLYEKND